MRSEWIVPDGPGHLGHTVTANHPPQPPPPSLPPRHVQVLTLSKFTFPPVNIPAEEGPAESSEHLRTLSLPALVAALGLH